MNKPKLLDQVRSVARLRHLSLRTEEAYSHWVRRFILFHCKRYPSEMGGDEIRQFLAHLAVTDHVSASTQNQALYALLFLYRDELQLELPYVDGIERAKRPSRVPVVFTRQVVDRLLTQLSGTYRQPTPILRACESTTLRRHRRDPARSRQALGLYKAGTYYGGGNRGTGNRWKKLSETSVLKCIPRNQQRSIQTAAQFY